MKRIVFYLGFLSFLNLASCASWNATVLKNNNVSLIKLQQSVTFVLPQGVRSVSPNAREFYSNYFVPYKDKFESGRKSPVRYSAHFSILGDRRPYTVEILVKREKLNPKRKRPGEKKYSPDGSDEHLGKKLARRLARILNKPVDERNVVDDFRVF